MLRGYCTETDWSKKRNEQKLTSLTFLDFLSELGVKVLKPFKLTQKEVGSGERYKADDAFCELLRCCREQRITLDPTI